MKVVIGIQNVTRELMMDVEMSPEEFTNIITEAMHSNTHLQLTDSQGQQYIIPGNAIAYAQVTSTQPRRVGFTF